MAEKTLKEGKIKYLLESEFAKQNNTGWKIHLSVRPENHVRVYEYLKSLPYSSKYGTSDQIGKDFTIYVGSWDSMRQCAEGLDQNIGNILESPNGDALHHDIIINPHIATRFDTRDPRFHQYGCNGIPYLKEDMELIVFNNIEFQKDATGNIRKFVKRAYEAAKAKWKKYFTGSDNQLEILINEFVNGNILPAWEILQR